MSNINVEVLLQTQSDKDELFTQTEILQSRLTKIFNARKNNPDFRVPLAEIEDIQMTHNLFISREFRPFSAIGFIYTKASQQPGPISYNRTIQYTIPLTGNFIGDMFLLTKFTGARSADSALPNTVARDMVRYCSLPAVRFVKNVSVLFDGVNGSSFSKMNYIHYLSHELQKDKLPMYQRMLGNEQVFVGELNPNPGFAEYTLNESYSSGAQTFQVRQPDLTTIYPFIFWFNLNPSQVLVNKNIDRITFKVETDDSALMLEKLATGTDGPVTYPNIETMDLYYKDIYVSRDIHEIYIKTKNFEVISTWRSETFSVNSSGGTTSLNARNWPVERLYLSYIPRINESIFLHWFKGKVLTSIDVPEFVSVGNPSAPPTYILDTQLARYYKESLPIDNLTLRTATIVYYENFPPEFFAFYNGATDFNDKVYPSDNGSLMVNFDYMPGYKGVPSGYSSTSNNTDFTIQYNSSFFSPSVTGSLHVSARILDSLLIDNKLLELRFNS